MSSLVLGHMRKKGWLQVPVATFLTDFAVHPLWVHPASTAPRGESDVAETASERGGNDARAAGRSSRPFSASLGRHRAATRCDAASASGTTSASCSSSPAPGASATSRHASRRSTSAGDYHPSPCAADDQALKASLARWASAARSSVGPTRCRR